MDTHGHDEISKVGTTLLKEAFQRDPWLRKAYSDEQLDAMVAFHMGNWFTDLTQMYDEVTFSGPNVAAQNAISLVNHVLVKLTEHYLVSIPSELAQKLHPSAEFANKLKEFGFDLEEEMKRGSLHWFASLPKQAEDKAHAFAEKARNAVDSAATELSLSVAMLFGPIGGLGSIAQGIRNLIRVIAYFKFAHPTDYKLAYSSFTYIFDQFFPPVDEKDEWNPSKTAGAKSRIASRGSYYPHHHLDRWPATDTNYAEPDKTRSQSRNGETHSPGLYPYMRDHIEYAAGHLADLDLHWAEPTFNKLAPKKTRPASMAPDAVAAWKKENDFRLAQAGHAVHLIEDFFAHSTFVEHALRLWADPASKVHLNNFLSLLPGDFQLSRNNAEEICTLLDRQYLATKLMMPNSVLALCDKDYTRFNRRLLLFKSDFYPKKDDTKHEKKHKEQLLNSTPRDSAGKPLEDPNVVTGYFDMQDTLLSLKHVVDESFTYDFASFVVNKGFKAALPGLETEVELEKKPPKSRALRDAFEWISDPGKQIKGVASKNWEALKQQIDDVGDELKLGHKRLTGEVDFYHVDPKVAKDLVGWLLPADTPPEIQQNLITAFLILGSTIKWGKRAISVYEAITTLAELLEGPAAWEKLFAETVINKALSELISDRLQIADDVFTDYLGKNRIGCHSLIAKDHEGDHCNDKAIDCAKAVDYYVIKTLLRWQESRGGMAVAKVQHEGNTTGSSAGKNVRDANPWIDWTELLEYFLRNPGGKRKGHHKIVLPYTITHITTDGDSLASLADKYRPTSVVPERFDWKLIALANYATADPKSINAILKQSRIGYPVKNTNYAWHAGVSVKIPWQKLEIPVYEPANGKLKETWFYRVMDAGWEVMRDGYEDKEAGQSVHAHDHELKRITMEQVQKIADRGIKDVAEKWISNYRSAAPVAPFASPPRSTFAGP